MSDKGDFLSYISARNYMISRTQETSRVFFKRHQEKVMELVKLFSDPGVRFMGSAFDQPSAVIHDGFRMFIYTLMF